MRRFRDVAGNEWEVHEVPCDALAAGCRDYLPPEYRDGWLIFAGLYHRRRLAPVPVDWDGLSDGQLSELLARAQWVSDPLRTSYGGKAR